MSSRPPINLAEYESLAAARMEPAAFDYVAGGAADEITLRANRAAFDRICLLPRVLVDVSDVSPATTVLGEPVALPVLLAPTAFQSLAHAEGERASARAAAAAGTIMVVSTMAAVTLEEVASAGPGPRWFQLYCYRDRRVTRRLVERAEAAGYRAICLTVDLPRVGRRERDLRNDFHLPPGVRPRNFDEFLDVEHLKETTADSPFHQFIHNLVDPSLTWEALAWLRGLTRLPLIVKGILSPADAALAADAGADAIVVSNHGGRQLDGVPATIDALARVVDAIGGRCEVLLDGGVRRGTDVAKALALGARAVLIGRPYVYALAVAGETGVRNALTLLRDEFESALALLGCRTVKDLSRDHLIVDG